MESKLKFVEAEQALNRDPFTDITNNVNDNLKDSPTTRRQSSPKFSSMKKKRMSLGRRVSFAPKANVRFFDKEQSPKRKYERFQSTSPSPLRQRTDFDASMEMTRNVGRVLKDIDSDDSLLLTTNVGNILESESRRQSEAADIDYTVNIGKILEQTPTANRNTKMESPLVKVSTLENLVAFSSPRKSPHPKRLRSMDSPGSDMEMTLNVGQTLDEADQTQDMDLTLPVSQPENEESENEDHTNEMEITAPIESKLEMDNVFKVNHHRLSEPANDSDTSFLGDSKVPKSFDEANFSPMNLEKSAFALPADQDTTMNTADLRKLLPPRIQLSEFLSMNGIRFLDSLATLRRNTIGVPDQTEISPVRELVLRNLTSASVASYETGCAKLSEMINQTRGSLVSLEDNINEGSVVIDKSMKDSSIVIQLKETKNWARISAKQLWRRFKRTQTEEFVNTLKSNVNKLNSSLPVDKSNEIEQLQAQMEVLQLQLSQLRERKRAFESFDPETVQQLEFAIEEQDEQISIFQSELDNLHQLTPEKQLLDELVKEEAELQESIDHSNNIIESNQEISLQDLATERQKYLFAEASIGFKVISLGENICLSNEHFQLEVNSETCECRVKGLAVAQEYVELLQTRLPKGKNLKETIREACLAISRISQLSKEVSQLSVPNTVIFHNGKLSVTCDFFDYETKKKFSARFWIEDYPFAVLKTDFVIEYGEVEEWRHSFGGFNNLSKSVESIRLLLK